MSWIIDLYETYEANFDMDNMDFKSNNTPLPIAHTTQMAQIEVIIDEDGEFYDARAIEDKADALTVIPVTEDSAARSSGPCSHPLEDKLEYVAGDYEEYTGKNNDVKHGLYIEALSSWCQSDYSCKHIKAVKKYIEKNCMIKNLVTKGILKISEAYGLLTNEKIAKIDQRESFVRFSVLDDDDDQIYELYRDKELFKLYVDYYKSTKTDLDLCYVTGKETSCSQKHGAKIRSGGDKAKLISANDSSGFTYRGRFANSEQAVSIGYEVSQKAHSALRWLVAKRQCFSIGEMTIVAWAISGKEIPNITKDSDRAFDDYIVEYPIKGYTDEAYTERLELAANGYKKDISDNDHIVVMGVEAATTGRLSVRFYHKAKGSDFIDNIEKWYRSCFWQWNGFVGTPSPYKIAVAAFGKNNDKLISNTIERLLPCIVNNRRIPHDVVKAAVSRVSNPNSFNNDVEWKEAIGIACALIKKKRYDYFANGGERKEWSMSLDRNERDRSYLFGRLLGAARKLEEVAVLVSEGTVRITAAERYYQNFARIPLKTWYIIDMSLQPYIQKLKKKNMYKYEQEINHICSLFDTGDFNNEPLSELYLLGYSCQLNSYDKENEDGEEK